MSVTVDPLATKGLKLWQKAVIAFLAMCASDLSITWMVVAEAHFQVLNAIAGDQVSYTAGLIVGFYGLGDVIREKRITKEAVVMYLAISAGNVVGTWAGVVLSKHAG